MALVSKKKQPRAYRVAVDETHHIVCCNDLPLQTPKGRPYRLPTAALAAAIAKEWVLQGDEKIDTSLMPLTRLAATAIDILPEKKERIIQGIVFYATTELLCHRSDLPPALAERQQQVWQPLLDWCALTFDALLCPGTGIMPIAQPPEAIAALEKAVRAHDDFRLVGLQAVVETSGSLILGLALGCGARTATEVVNAAELDLLFQREAWGNDPVTEAHMDSVTKDIEAAARWFALLDA